VSAQPNSNLLHLLDGKQIVAVTCRVFGDTGKGKFVDYFGEWADIIARGTGGANAGHSIELNGKSFVFHLIPSAILHDGDGKTNIIGNGVALDPGIFCSELDMLAAENKSFDNLRISHNAKLVLPQHLVLDRARERMSGKIGSTGRGMGPVYQDFVSRIGLTANDLLNKDEFARKLEANLREKLIILRQCAPGVVHDIMHDKHLLNGAFWDSQSFFNIDAIVEHYMMYAERLGDMIVDTDTLMREAHAKGKRILLEGAQGDLLSVTMGTYPFVTASDCSTPGLASGVGLLDRHIDLDLGITKAYTTRVGRGPLPTELGGETSDRWCPVRRRVDQ
jgi:adenylosuccinate synthase